MKVLLVRLDGLGDTVLTTPLLRALHAAGARVTCIASPIGAQALDGHPGVEELITISLGDSSLGEKLRLGTRLRDARFDAALTVTEKSWGYLWVNMTSAPRRVGFWAGATQPVKALLFRGTITHRVPSPNDPSQASELHEVERIMRLVEPLGVRAEAGPLWIPVAEDVEPGDAIAVHTSWKWVTDGYGAEWLVDLVRELGAVAPVRLSWGPSEAALGRQIEAELPQVERVDAGAFADWCRGLRRCRLLVSMDTGAAHVGASLGMKVVDVFPSAGADHTVPRWKPWEVPHRVVLRGPWSDEESRRVLAEVVSASRALVQERIDVR